MEIVRITYYEIGKHEMKIVRKVQYPFKGFFASYNPQTHTSMRWKPWAPFGCLNK